MRRLILALMCIGFTIIDNTIIPLLSFNGVYGSILFSFIICYSIVSDEWDALYVALIGGALQDIYMFKGFGINCLSNMILCILACKIGTNLFKERSLIPIVINFFMSILKGLFVVALLYMCKQGTDIQSVAIMGVYNLIISILMYKRVFKLSQKPYMKKDWNF